MTVAGGISEANEHLATVESRRGSGGVAETTAGNGGRLVVLGSLDDVRRWLDVDLTGTIDRLAGFRVMSVAEAASLRHDDPELAIVAERAARTI